MLAALLLPQPSPLVAFLFALEAALAVGAVLASLLPVTGPAVSDWFSRRRWKALMLVSFMVPPALIAVPRGAGSIGPFLLWFLLPVVLFLFLPEETMEPGRGRKESLGGRLRSALIVLATGLLVFGFDTRLSLPTFAVFPEGRYEMAAIWVAAILCLGPLPLNRGRRIRHRRIILDRRFLVSSVLGLLVLSALLIPAGLATGLLTWNPGGTGVADALVALLGIVFTIALPEELAFRHLAQRELTRRFHKTLPVLAMIVLVSVAFGFFHWNNVSSEFRVHYIAFAGVAGLVYGVVYRRGGLAAAVTVHALVDWIWLLLFRP